VEFLPDSGDVAADQERAWRNAHDGRTAPASGIRARRSSSPSC